MLGVILCGGESSRMGTDKGLLQPEGQTFIWARSAANKLSSLSLSVVISVKESQKEGYSVFFPEEQLIQDNKTLEIRGPLYGVLSIHIEYPEEDLFVLACDMPLMEPFVLAELLTQQKSNKKSEAFLFTNHGEPEPLCAIYTADGLSKILQLYKTGNLHKHSMKYMLSQLNCLQIPVKAEQEKYFQNFNAHAALNGL